jgi:hypothetical protein
MKKHWRDEFVALYKQHMRLVYPEAMRSHPLEPKIGRETTANGLTQLILKWLKYAGHYANRISTQGQARVQKIPRFDIHSEKLRYHEKTSWTKGHTMKGTPDITGIIYGKAVWIEVKVGKDRMSYAQLEQKGSIEGSGGLYFIAHDMQSFVDWYYKIIEDGAEIGVG